MATNATLNGQSLSTAIQHAAQTIAAFVAATASAARQAVLREKTRLELERLTDRELQDIGLVRGDIDSVVRTL